jgi:hypothetical protein
MPLTHSYCIYFLSKFIIAYHVPYPILKISALKMKKYSFRTHVLKCIGELIQTMRSYSAIIPKGYVEMKTLGMLYNTQRVFVLLATLCHVLRHPKLSLTLHMFARLKMFAAPIKMGYAI